MTNERLFILRVVVVTLAILIVGMMGVLLTGAVLAFFDNRVDTDQIYTLIGPAFQTVVGSFVGMLGGFIMGRHSATDEPPAKVDPQP